METLGKSLQVDQVTTPAGDTFTVELYQVSVLAYSIYVNNTHVIMGASHNEGKRLYKRIKENLRTLVL